jgi:hypothetical protein
MFEDKAPSELVLYPSPEELTSLPAKRVLPFILDRLSEQARQYVPDLERSVGLGQMARLLSVPDAEAALERWLVDQQHLSDKACDTAAMFLQGYWPNQPGISRSLVKCLLHALHHHPGATNARDSAVMALGLAHLNLAGDELGLEIRRAFLKLWPRRVAYQKSVRLALERTLANDLKRLGLDGGQR